MEITDSGAYRAPDDVEDEGDVNVDDDREEPLTEDAISKQIGMTTCEERDRKSGPIARFSFDVGTLTGSPTPNELEKIVRAGHVLHPNQFPCDVAGKKIPSLSTQCQETKW